MSEGKQERPAEGRRPDLDPDRGPQGRPESGGAQQPGTSWGAANQERTHQPQPDEPPVDGRPDPDRGRSHELASFDLSAELDPEAEESLRRLLQGVGDQVEPNPEALERIRHAIPVRRARRRNALIGAGAAALAVGVTLPLMQAGVVPGPLNDRPTNAAHSQQADPEGEHEGNVLSGGQGDHDAENQQNGGGSGSAEDDQPHTSPSDRDSESPDSDELSTAPSCSRAQLGDADVDVGDPDSRGRVYGAFKLSNVSDETCRVRGGGDGLTATGQGRAPSADVQILDHTSGGKASELPDPSEASGPVILRPGEAYQVKFAWLPSIARGGNCVPGNPDPDPTDPPDNGGDSSGGSDGSGNSGGGDNGDGGDGGDGGDEDNEGHDDGENTGMSALASGGGGEGEPGTAVVLNYTPAAGEPELPAAYVKSSCAGTIYRTSPLPAS